MRWDSLFHDLEGQLEFELGAEQRDRDAEDERLRIARLTLRDRVLASRGSGDVALELGSAGPVRVVIDAVGRDWVAGDAAPPDPRSVIVPLRAIVAIRLSPQSVAGSLVAVAEQDRPPRLSERIGLAFVLRDLARRRRAVTIHADGRWHGTIDRVGGDHLDLALHSVDAARRASAVSEVRVVPFAAIDLIQL